MNSMDKQNAATTASSASMNALGGCLSPASFWRPRHLVWSAWVEHGPFAFWLIDALRPRTLVELGTHNGYSFFALCQAVKTLGLSTACYAVDTWQGDDHAGFYSDEIYSLVSEVRNAEYTDIATLIRSTFDEALPYFPEQSIDLLHIDGRHGYEDVKHDFETWRHKLSVHAVVLFHDINVRRDGFGVWKLWDELKALFPSFEFVHGHGLGVLFTGAKMPEGVRALFDAATLPEQEAVIRIAYSRLGQAASDTFDSSRDLASVRSQLEEAHAANQALMSQVQSASETTKNEKQSAIEAYAALESRLSDMQEKLERQHEQLVKQRGVSERLANANFELSEAARTRHPITSWVDRWSRSHPRRARWVWGGLRAGHMVVTFQFLRLGAAAVRRIK